jgi:exosortase A-associated hydrolase 2
VEAFHLSWDGRPRFCILHTPPEGSAQDRTIIYAHPFGEEMNKSRRMAALQARALAKAGSAVLQVDLLGCGDSDGEFADASWSRWVDDIAAAATWLSERFGGTACLWGLRVGCLLAVDAARAMVATPDLLFWQPVLSGRQYLQQLLRLRVAAQLLGPADANRVDSRELRGRFDEGRAVEIAGYEMPAALALGLEAADLEPIAGSVRVTWIEVSATGEPQLSPAARARVDVWRRGGHRMDTRAVAGPAFWQSQEIVECPALIDATLAAMAASPT